MTDYFLVFNSHYDRDKGLDSGRLSLNSLENGTIDIWVAASSIDSKQFPENYHQKGGMIPPQYRVPNLKNWMVETRPIAMPNIKGVEGNFYKINPHTVTTDKGGVRGDFGIHRDANVPGSLGCIVLDNSRFAVFEKRIKTINVSTIPLFVFYS